MLKSWMPALVFGLGLFAPAAYGADQPILGIPVGDNIFVSCEWRVAAIFPTYPMHRDFTYTVGHYSGQAREFYVDRDSGRLSVTVAYFPDGPDEDLGLLEAAAAQIRPLGTVRLESEVAYDTPRVPGRQMNIDLDDGRVLRANVYVARQHLYITKATSERSDSSAFRFEQSVSYIDENGTDLDSNTLPAGSTLGTSAGLPSRQYVCEH